MSENRYRPIRDYGLIGDAHTAALVSSDGSIDWLCWPRFDSPAVFCRLLDKEKGGHFRVGPAGSRAAASRSYVEGTNVLATIFSTDGGRFRLTDLMPVERLNRRHEGEDIASHYRVIRLVEGLSGEAEVEVSFRPTFDYALVEATFHPYDGGVFARNGREALALSCPAPFREDPSGGVTARFKVAAGQRVWVALTYLAGEDAVLRSAPPFDADLELEQTLEYWREYRTLFHLAKSWGLHESSVRRTIRRVEDILTKSRAFRLPGRKKLEPADHEIEFVVVDVAETPVERPKKRSGATTAARRSGTR